MSFFQNLLGIIGTSFKFNKGNATTTANEIRSVFSGVASASAIEVRDQAGVFIVGRGADPNPLNVNDWVTIGYLNTVVGVAAAVKEIRFAVALGSINSVTQIPDNAVVIDAELNILSVYDNAATIAVATGAIPLMATTDSNPQAVGLYSVHQDTDATDGPAVVAVTIAPVPTTGTARCIVRFVTTPML